ncbi:MAG: TonB-dependent receptor [Polaromonas sp.]|nr:TonB-dependent receptor [Gemmatimonadaceae bacterium]
MPSIHAFVQCAIRAGLVASVPVALTAQGRPTNTDSLTRRDSIARLKAVTVVAAPAERSQPVSATHIDAATIRQTPSLTPYDLLRQVGGVEVHEQGQGPGFASNASLRGFSSDHSTDLATWVDGVPLNEPVNGHAEGYNDLSVLFPGGVQDMDILHGPTSALFGNFALAGVLNVRTLERMRGTEATLSGGSFGRAEGMVLTGFDHGSSGGGVLGARYQRENGFRPNARYDVAQGHARLVRDLAPGVTLDGGAELYGGSWNSPGFLSEDEFVRHEYDIVTNPTDGGYKRRAQERLTLRVLTSDLAWRTTAYATQSRWQLFLTIPPAGGRFEGLGSQTEEEDARIGYGATSALTRVTPRTELTVGAESRWDRSEYENYLTTARSRDSTNALVTGRQLSGAVFVQSHADVTDRWRIDAGLRYDALNTRSSPDLGEIIAATHGLLSPKLGSLVRVTDDLGIHANVSRGFRSANGVISDPALVPITAWAYEAGLKLDRDGTSASVALFRMDVSNEQTLNPVTLVSTNGGASRRQGVELEWRVPVTPQFTTSGSWTFNDARYRRLVAAGSEGDGRPEILDGRRVFNTASYVGASALEFAPRDARLRLRVSGNWIGAYSPFDEPGVLVGGYGLMHLSASVPLDGVEVEAGVRNALDRAYPELIAGHTVSPGSARTLVVSVRARL